MIEDAIGKTDRLRFGTTSNRMLYNGGIAFERMHAAFIEAMNSHPNLYHESYYTFAGQITCIRTIGDRLSECISKPFSHLLIQDKRTITPIFQIDLLDASETAIPCPIDSTFVEDRIPESIWYAEYGIFSISSDNRFILCERPNMITLFDRVIQRLIGWTSTSANFSLYEYGKPLHFPLLVWHWDRGTQVIHSGLVSKSNRGVLFIGKGGSGKTTASLACLCAGFNYLGDDYIGLQLLGDGSFIGHSLYSSTWIMADHSTQFQGLSRYIIKSEKPGEEKSLIHLFQIFPKRIARVAPISALVLPRIVEGCGSQIRVASKSEALFAIAPSSMILLPSSGTDTLNKLVQLVERVPSYWLEFGRSLEEIPYYVKGILKEVSQL